LERARPRTDRGHGTDAATAKWRSLGGGDALKLDRVDLADIHAPATLARVLHGLIGQIDGPIPVAEIARALDIVEVREGALDGCEGVLITDRQRSRGSILVNNKRGAQAARFSI